MGFGYMTKPKLRLDVPPGTGQFVSDVMQYISDVAWVGCMEAKTPRGL